MLHKGLGGMAGLGLTGFAGFLATALQGSESSTGDDWLWIAAFASLALGIVGGIGWLLTRDDESRRAPLPTVNARVQRSSGTNIAGRDVHIHNSPMVSSGSLMSSVHDILPQARRAALIDALVDLAEEAARIDEHPGAHRGISVYTGEPLSAREIEQEKQQTEHEELCTEWSADVRAKLERDGRAFLPDWDAVGLYDRAALLREIIKELRVKG